MLGETDANWRDCIERTLALEPDSVTIYQMELPYNTTISGDLLKGGGQFAEPVAELGDEAALGAGSVRGAASAPGYHIGSAYTAVKDPVEDDVRLPRSSVAGRRPGSASASRRSATSTASTCRTSTRGRSLQRGDRERRDSARPRLSARPTKSG